MLFQLSEHKQTFSYQSSTFAPHCLMSDLQSRYTWERAEELIAIGWCFCVAFSLWGLLIEDQDMQGHLSSSFTTSSHPSCSKSRLTLLCTSSLPWQNSSCTYTAGKPQALAGRRLPLHCWSLITALCHQVAWHSFQDPLMNPSSWVCQLSASWPSGAQSSHLQHEKARRMSRVSLLSMSPWNHEGAVFSGSPLLQGHNHSLKNKQTPPCTTFNWKDWLASWNLGDLGQLLNCFMMWSKSLCLLTPLSHPNQIASSAQTRLSFIKQVYSIEHSEALVSPEASRYSCSTHNNNTEQFNLLWWKVPWKIFSTCFCVYRSAWHDKMPQKIL